MISINQHQKQYIRFLCIRKLCIFAYLSFLGIYKILEKWEIKNYIKDLYKPLF